MKIVEVVHGFPPEVIGGTERYVRFITEGLRNRDHALSVYTGSLKWTERFTVDEEHRETEAGNPYEVTTIHRNDLYFDRWDKAFNPVVEKHFRAFLAERKPDLVHVHHWVRLTSSLCATAARAGIPVVATLHDLYVTCPRFFRIHKKGHLCEAPLSVEHCVPCAERWLFQGDEEIAAAVTGFTRDVISELSCATRILAPSTSHADTVLARLGLEDQAGIPDIEVLPHGTLTALQPSPRPEPGGPLRIVYFSHLYPSKGPGVLLDAFKAMAHRDRAELHLFGAEVLPEFGRELRKCAEGLSVTFHGPYAPEELSAFPMDVAVIPTQLAESYSFILDEAAALGVPVVASDTGAIRERADSGTVLVPPGDASALAGVLDGLVADPSRLDALRERPAARVLGREEHLDRLETIYEEARSAGPAKDLSDRTLDHLEEQWERREMGFKELIRSEQWEALVASLRKRIVELEVELSQRPPRPPDEA